MKFLQTYEIYKNSLGAFDIITKENFYKLYKENCKSHSNNTIQLFKGMKTSGNYVYSHPKSERTSIERENIHVILMSELDSWKNFPKYNKSIVGTINKDDADHYGTLYEIIPFDNTKIGVCSRDTVWDSFGGFDYNGDIKLTDSFLRYWLNIDSTKNFTWEELKVRIKNKKYIDYYPSIHEMRFLETMRRCESGKWKIGKEKIFLNYFDSIDEDKVREYGRTIKPETIINFIELLFEPRNFDYLLYDKNFSKNMNKLCEKYKTDNLQIWCESPILLIDDKLDLIDNLIDLEK